ncbi:MAG: hypothetical protein RL701_4275 [Pseudomonadota bacterium]
MPTAGTGTVNLPPVVTAGSGPIVSPPPIVPTMPLAPVGDRNVTMVDECPGMLPPATAQALKAPGIAPSQRWLYPYANTVFPRGLTAPVLQWEGPKADAIHIHITSMLFDYQGCFPGTGNASFPFPQAAWDEAGKQSRGEPDPLIIEVTGSVAGQVFRLPKLQVVFALATLKSAIYYNTYGSAIANQKGIVGGVVMRVQPGHAEPEVFLSASDPTSCVGCHSVSADGSRMVAEQHVLPGTFEGPSASYDLKAAGTGVNPPPLQSALKRAGFAALYPDGSVYLTTGRVGPGPIASLPGTPVGNVPGTFGPETSKLYDTATGAEIPGSGIIDYAYMPNFSVDGTAIVFNQVDASNAASGHALAVMNFDKATQKFSGLRSIFQDPALFPGWPSFLPEVVSTTAEFTEHKGKRVIFALGAPPDFATQEQPIGFTPHASDLWWTDADSGMSVQLASANGQNPQGMTYLPYGERDAHKNYIPTVSPVAAGGYFWLFFTSKRNYGNLFVADPPESRAESKKIWVTAIDINAQPGTDPSHPAFFLPGQEIESGNIRAFAALEPCKANGTTCESGVDCCCGFCTDKACACKQSCAKLDERCTTAADCCDKELACIGGYCGVNPG